MQAYILTRKSAPKRLKTKNFIEQKLELQEL